MSPWKGNLPRLPIESNIVLLESSYEVLEGFLRGVVAAAEMKQQGGDIACFVDKRRSRGTCKSGGDVFDLIGDVDPTDEDGDIGMGDSTGVSASLDGEIFSEGKKCWESNIDDNDNTRDEGERDSEAKRPLVKSSKNLEEVFPGEAGK
nr:hypothetical protein [Tanacetum cinerariifolium]